MADSSSWPKNFPWDGPDGQTVRLLVVLGTRPEAVKLFPVIQTLQEDERLEIQVAVTGQHQEMVDQILQPVGIVPDHSLRIMRPDQSLNDIVQRATPRLDLLFEQTKPQMVLVQGDTTSALCAAMAAFHRLIPVAHVEAGLRSGDRLHPFPEETNRRMIGSLADLHFAPTGQNAENLVREGVARQAICVTGNTVVDSLQQSVADPELLARHRWNGHLPGDGRIVLITTHRRESWMANPAEGDNPRPLALEGILLAIRDSLEEHPSVDFVFTLHPNPRVREPVYQILGERPNLHLADPLPYLTFVELMTRSTVVLTDSGGIQEEAPSLGLPVLVIREKTERTEALALPANKLVGTNRDTIAAELQRCLAQPPRRPPSLPLPNPFGDGLASRRIQAAVLGYFGLGERLAEFDPVEISPAMGI